MNSSQDISVANFPRYPRKTRRYLVNESLYSTVQRPDTSALSSGQQVPVMPVDQDCVTLVLSNTQDVPTSSAVRPSLHYAEIAMLLRNSAEFEQTPRLCLVTSLSVCETAALLNSHDTSAMAANPGTL